MKSPFQRIPTCHIYHWRLGSSFPQRDARRACRGKLLTPVITLKSGTERVNPVIFIMSWIVITPLLQTERNNTLFKLARRLFDNGLLGNSRACSINWIVYSWNTTSVHQATYERFSNNLQNTRFCRFYKTQDFCDKKLKFFYLVTINPELSLLYMKIKSE